MYNFFATKEMRQGTTFTLTGADHNHIKNVLRMKKEDRVLVSCEGLSHLCSICSLDEEKTLLQILEENHQNTELPVSITLFQGLPKADKMEWILQKTVELGVSSVVPVEMNRCVVKLDPKKKGSKQIRWQAIAEAAAKQSKRSLIPRVAEPISFSAALSLAKEMDLFLVPYENKEGMKATKEALSQIQPGMKIGILIGPEGGFDPKEIEETLAVGGIPISLGRRILRTETAAITAVGMCMLQIESMPEA